jgi:hypothetical protein
MGKLVKLAVTVFTDMGAAKAEGAHSATADRIRMRCILNICLKKGQRMGFAFNSFI